MIETACPAFRFLEGEISRSLPNWGFSLAPKSDDYPRRAPGAPPSFFEGWDSTRKHKLWSRAGQQILRELPLKPWAGRRRDDLLGLLAMLDQQIEPLDQAVKKKPSETKWRGYFKPSPA